ncbi:nucleotide-binding protein [Actinomyces sp. 432]|uniref:OB-fold nucleic acid binding domain-containing protein n=1 Tax=Actinomyces sp. 432 TaxID=2057798 RepID=UPI001374148C|nr:OB-fold nucleic acid binding domain-containing protein [Actinomyces sp. 432]QHO90793.1 nucleotide-binding protein [Actinomyces sp. 432]
MSRRSGTVRVARLFKRLRPARRPRLDSGAAAAVGAHAPSTRPGDILIKDLAPRRRAHVSGVLRAVTYRPASAKPVLVGQLDDGTGVVNLIWIGRRAIVGIEPGARLRAEGMVVSGRTRPSIYNPLYELLGEDI